MWRSHARWRDFSETIARNIAVDDGEVDVKRLEQSARIANIHDYIMMLPMKYNTQIGRDGIGLSQGQKQRILIARAVYKNPSYIFLDEATNALDAKNERAIVENLNEFYRGRTVVVVAHRLSTVRNADQIIVIDGGKSLKLEIILRSLKREVHIIIWSRISLNLEIEKLNINNIKIMT